MQKITFLIFTYSMCDFEAEKKTCARGGEMGAVPGIQITAAEVTLPAASISGYLTNTTPF